MKVRSILTSLAASAVALSLLVGCSGAKKEDSAAESHEHATPEETPMTAAEPQFQTDAAFQQQLSGVFTSYVELKDAFVSSDVVKVKEKAKSTDETLAKVDMKLLSGAAHNDWMTYLSSLQSALKEIQAGADIEAQRKSFSQLSDNLYKSIKAYGLGGGEAFYEFCPMAFNNEGGYWLSDQKEIRNPYFGDQMLTCGTVKEKLK